MKKLTLAALSAIATIASISVNAATFEATNNSAETNICVAAAKGNTSKFYQTLRQQQRDIRTVAKGVKCNGVDIAQFAKVNGANKIAKKLSRFQ